MLEGLEKRVLLLDTWYQNDRPFFILHGYGGVYADRLHTFPTRPLKSEDRGNKVMDKLKSNSDLRDYKATQWTKPFNVVQVDAPVSEKDKLPKEFMRGGYRHQVFRDRRPGTWLSVNEKILDAMLLKNEFNEGLEGIRQDIAEQFKDRRQAYRTRMFNELNYFFYYNKNNSIKRIAPEIIKKRAELHEIHKSISKKFPTLVIKKTKELNIVLKDIEQLKPLSQITYEEFMKQKRVFLDSELPGYDTDHPELTPYVLMYEENGKSWTELHTLRNSRPNDRYKVIKHKSQVDLIKGVRDSIKRENPLVMLVYNAKADLIEFPKIVGSFDNFDIGANGTKPHKEATTKNNERVAVHGRCVIDLYRALKIMHHGNSNKLEPTIRFLQEVEKVKEKFVKEESYSDVTELNEESKKGNLEADDRLNKYAFIDTKQLKWAFHTKLVQRNIRSALWMQENYRVSVQSLLWSQSSINLPNMYKYFDAIGTYRTTIFRMGKKFHEARRNANKSFIKDLEQGLADKLVNVSENEDLQKTLSVSGDYENVHEAYIPYGYSFGPLIARNFPESEELFCYRGPLDGRKSFTNHEMYYLARHANALTDFMIETSYEFENLKEEAKKTNHQLRFDKELSEADELEMKANFQENKLYGNFRVLPDEVKGVLSRLHGRIKTFINETGVQLLHQRGPYLYFTGDTNAFKTYKNLPIIRIETIPRAHLSIKDGRRNLTYQKQGYYNKRILNKEDPTPELIKVERSV